MPDEITEAWGRNLRTHRHRGRLTLKEVAEAIGVDVSSVSRWESGEREPRRFRRSALAEFYGVPVNELFPLDPDGEAA
jgi:transcriptional regulator with XRE-family HTH domain